MHAVIADTVGCWNAATDGSMPPVDTAFFYQRASSTSAGLLGYGNGVVGKVVLCGSASVLRKYAHATNVKHVRCFAVTDALTLLWHCFLQTARQQYAQGP